MKHSITFFILLCLLSGNSLCQTHTSLKRFNVAIRVLISEYFPKSSFTTTDTTLRAELYIKDFWIHAQTKIKVSHSQDTVKTQGPNRGGIYCKIELVEGQPVPRQAEDLWNGERLPRSDCKYFYESYLFPYSDKNNCYLNVTLKFPKGTSEKFLSDFENLINGFENYL
jgi:hypothetical protein